MRPVLKEALLSCAACWLLTTVFSQLLRVVSRCPQVNGPGEGRPSPLLRVSSRGRGVCRAASPLAAQLGQMGSPALLGSFLSSFPCRAGWGLLLQAPSMQAGLFQKSCHAAVPTAGHSLLPHHSPGWGESSSGSRGVPRQVPRHGVTSHRPSHELQLSQVGASLSPSHSWEWDARDSPPTPGGRL